MGLAPCARHPAAYFRCPCFAGALSDAVGRYIFAVGGNLEAARLSGVPVDAVRFGCYMASGGCAAIAGILTAAYVNSGDPNVGVAWELYVIAAVVIGGTSLMGGKGRCGGRSLGPCS